jgi:hypothetical protein
MMMDNNRRRRRQNHVSSYIWLSKVEVYVGMFRLYELQPQHFAAAFRHERQIDYDVITGARWETESGGHMRDNRTAAQQKWTGVDRA